MSYKTVGYLEASLKNHVPFYWSGLGFWQGLFMLPISIFLNMVSVLFFVVSLISPIVHVADGSPLWSLFFLLLSIPFSIYPALTLFMFSQPEVNRSGYSWDEDDIKDLRIDKYLVLPKDIKTKLKPLAKVVNNNRDDLSEWQSIVDQYYDLNKTGVLDSKNKILLDSIKADLEAQKQTQKIMREQGWLK